MKKFIPITSLLLLFTFLYSCKGTQKRNPPNTITTQPAKGNSSEVDPYFVKSDTINSSFGPNSITRNIMQDTKGNIWLATWEGIIRYDGNTFTNFTIKENLRRFHVFSLLEDSKGILWFGTIGGGVYRYDGKIFTNFTTNEGLVNNRVGCIYEDKKGIIWIGTGGGISRYDGKSFTNFTTEDGLTDNDINSILEDKTGKLWFGARGYACYYDGKTFTKITTEEGLPFVNVRRIMEDKKGNIWLSGQDGLWRYRQKSFTKITSGFVGYIYEDKKGNIWTSSASYGNSNNWELTRYDEQGTATQINKEVGMYFGILEDKDGRIWVGTLDGVYFYDGITISYLKKPKVWE